VVSDPNVGVPNIITTMLEVSTSQDFSGMVTESLETNLSKVYTGDELNTLAKNLQAEPGVATPLYFRLKAFTGNNMEPVYSNVVPVNVTAYKIDMSVGYILDKNQADTGMTLYSASSNGIYTGFVGATGWYNFYLKEGDGTIWGNDAVTGTPFLLSSENDPNLRWNFWFPGLGGCYFAVVNTPRKEWTALLIPALTVSGDITGEMTFDRPRVRWTVPFTASSTSVTFRVSGTGKQYNSVTGTNDASAISSPVAFSQSGGKISLTDLANDITVTVPEPGAYTLLLDLSNPKEFTFEAVKGTDVPVEVNKQVYVPGIDDGTSGGWTFDNVLNLYKEETLSYAGVVNANSLWGYTINTEKDNWDDKYTLGSGDAMAGSLALKGPTNLPAPPAGLYLMDVSLKNLTYSLTKIGEEIYVSGLNDVWDFHVKLAKTAQADTFGVPITTNCSSPYGFQVHLDTSWNHKLGGAAGKLVYGGSNLTDDATLVPGTYTMTVNLLAGTYVITQ